MKKFKICVYAICKNEEKFVERWVNSMSEADYICVLDTGSTDNTLKLLKKYKNVIVKQKKFDFFRFDVARNESMKLIPEDSDICICTDLDEVFEKGWRKILEENITEKTKQVRYRYTWNYNEDGSEGYVFLAEKIHTRKDFYWKNPVHEVLSYKGKDSYEIITLENLRLYHHADNLKARSQYLPLLELAVKEDENNDRNMHYLGREYFFHGQYENAIKTLKKHLSMPSSTWKDERSSSMRYIAKCYELLSDFEQAEYFYKLSIIETPNLRESYYELACFYFNQKNFLDCLVMLESMLNIKYRELNYISSPYAWGENPYVLLGICYYNLKEKQKAITSAINGLKLFPNSKDLLYNLNVYNNM